MNLAPMTFALATVLSFAPSGPAADGLDIRVTPADHVYVCETNAARGYYDAMIYNIAYVNRSGEVLTLDHAVVEAIQNDECSLRLRLDGEALQRDADKLTRLQDAGFLGFYDFMLPTKVLLEDAVTISPTLRLNPRTAVISTSIYLGLRGIPDRFKITAFARNGKGRTLESSILLPAVPYRQANPYLFPLRGAWWVGGGADVSTDHRWVAFEQFAYDLAQVGEDGLTYRNDGERVEDYRCFGQNVVAAADGDVVDVRDRFADDPALLKRKGETEDDYGRRMSLVQRNFLKTDFTAAAGNFVVIRHRGEEYSFYAHLQKDSLRVKKGDRVRQGQVIAKVGHSGNSTEPHLHLQISNGADPFRSRAVPVKFTHRDGERYLRTGDIIRN